jgi:hypothetical protein
VPRWTVPSRQCADLGHSVRLSSRRCADATASAVLPTPGEPTTRGARGTAAGEKPGGCARHSCPAAHLDRLVDLALAALQVDAERESVVLGFKPEVARARKVTILLLVARDCLILLGRAAIAESGCVARHLTLLGRELEGLRRHLGEDEELDGATPLLPVDAKARRAPSDDFVSRTIWKARSGWLSLSSMSLTTESMSFAASYAFAASSHWLAASFARAYSSCSFGEEMCDMGRPAAGARSAERIARRCAQGETAVRPTDARVPAALISTTRNADYGYPHDGPIFTTRHRTHCGGCDNADLWVDDTAATAGGGPRPAGGHRARAVARVGEGA